MPTGEILQDQVEALKGIGRWLWKYGESIYGTRGGPVRNGEWGGMCHKGRTVYAHVLRWDRDQIVLPGFAGQVKECTALTGGEVKMRPSGNGLVLLMDEAKQDPLDTVVKLELDAHAGP